MSYRLALRELVNRPAFFLIFIINMGLGLFGLALVDSFKLSFSHLMAKDGEQRLGAHLSITTRQELSATHLQTIHQQFGSNLKQQSLIKNMYSMAQLLRKNHTPISKLVNLKVIDEFHPLIGQLGLMINGPLNDFSRQELITRPTAWVSAELSSMLKIVPGDRLQVGEEVFFVQDIVKEDSSRSLQWVSYAPSMYVSHPQIAKADLIKEGSTIFYAYNFTFHQPELAPRYAEDLKNLFSDPGIKVLLPSEADPATSRIFSLLSDYLGLAALAAIFLSAIGSHYLFRRYLSSKLKEVAIYRTLGMSDWNIQKIFLTQVIFLSLVAGSFACALTIVAIKLLQQAPNQMAFAELIALMAIDHRTFFMVFCVALGPGITTVMPLLFKLADIAPQQLFSEQDQISWGRKNHHLLYLPALMLFLFFSIYSANSYRVGLIFFGGLLGSMILLVVSFLLLLEAIDHILRLTDKVGVISLVTGICLRLIARQRLSSIMAFLSLGLGSSLLVLLYQLEGSLRSQLTAEASSRPALFLFDIQEEQVSGLQQLLAEQKWQLSAISPMIRARLTKVNNQEFNRHTPSTLFTTREEEDQQRFRQRGINLSYRTHLTPSEKVVKGKFWEQNYIEGSGQLPEISIEKRYAQRMDIHLGDLLTFEVLEVEFSGVVTNFRQVQWSSFLPNFFIQFQPGVLENAPKTFIASSPPLEGEQKQQFQDFLAQYYPNISAIDVQEVLNKTLALMEKLQSALIALAMLCLVVGLFVLFSVAAYQASNKKFEMAMMKILGMRLSQVRMVIVGEFTIIGLLAVISGTLVGMLTSYLLTQLLFEGVWEISYLRIGKLVGFVFFSSLLVSLVSVERYINMKSDKLFH